MAQRSAATASGSWWRDRSLASRFSLALTALLLPLFALVIAASRGDAERRYEGEVQSSTLVAKNAAATLGAFVHDIEGAMLSGALLIGDDPRPLDQGTRGLYMASLIRQYPELRAIFLTDTRGVVVATDSNTGIGTDLSSRSYVMALRGGAETNWSGGVAGLQSGEITVAFARVVRGPSGPTRGYLIAAFYPQRVLANLNVQFAADATLSLIDSAGGLLYTTDTRALNDVAIRDLSKAPGAAAVLRGETVTIRNVATPFAGEPELGAAIPVRGVGWGLFLTRPQATIDAAVLGDFWRTVVFLGLAMAFTLLMAALIARRLARPLHTLAVEASVIASGGSRAIPDESGGGSEVVDLNRAMQRMQNAVVRRERELRLLARASDLLSGSLDYHARIVAAARVPIPDFADVCLIHTRASTGLQRASAATAGGAHTQLVDEVEIAGGRRGGSATFSRVAETGESALVADAGVPMRSLLIVPLRLRGQVLGTITFATVRDGRSFDEGDRLIANQLAERISSAVENARLYEEVQAAVRTRDEFLASAAHELKTPLTTIKGLAQFLDRLSGTPQFSAETVRLRLKGIVGAADSMAASVEELLDLVRLQLEAAELRRAPEDLVAIVRRAWKTVEPLAGRHHVSIESDAPEVLGTWDAPRLQRAIANLIGNAVKYSPAGGDIVVRVGREEGEAFVAVRDQGMGIPAADLDRIFERFRRGSNVVGKMPGSGLGLAIVRQIVERHGGTIRVESEEGRGAQFIVRLPLEQAVRESDPRQPA